MVRLFILPVVVSFVILIAVFFGMGAGALLTVAVLSVLEITLSFDNAVVNAKVLHEMSAKWRKRFLTWGMLIAVFGTRLVLPVFLVSATVLVSPIVVAKLALFGGSAYGELLAQARYAIDAFGGAFLAMLSLRYFLDGGKTVHWIRSVETRLSKLGDIEALEIAIVLVLVALLAFLAPANVRAQVLVAGIAGILISVAIETLIHVLSKEGKGTAAHGIGLFIYINILDSAFSLDGVVGAFALTRDITLIVIGLGIGAYFVRTLTVYLTEKRMLESLVFIEHGAYWAIFGLSLSMFVSILVDVPQILTGSVGLIFMLASYYSSTRARARML